MAKYTVTHKCGHEAVLDIPGGKPSLRQWKLDQAAVVDCWDCQKAANVEAAQEQATAFALPVLVGSEKQVQWALTLRSKALAGIEGMIASYRMRLDGQPAAAMAMLDGVVNTVKTAMVAETDAKAWIDARFNDYAAEADRRIREALMALRNKQA